MKLKTALFAFLTMGLVGALSSTTACGKNDCEDAADRITAKSDECGLTTGDGSDGDGAEAECTDEAGMAAQKLAQCYEDASCEAIKGEDAEGATAYLECITSA